MIESTDSNFIDRDEPLYEIDPNNIRYRNNTYTAYLGMIERNGSFSEEGLSKWLKNTAFTMDQFKDLLKSKNIVKPRYINKRNI